MFRPRLENPTKQGSAKVHFSVKNYIVLCMASMYKIKSLYQNWNKMYSHPKPLKKEPLEAIDTMECTERQNLFLVYVRKEITNIL
jgi:hypothetical protein